MPIDFNTFFIRIFLYKNFKKEHTFYLFQKI